MEVIKKYSNRKLYSTKLSKYVTLNYVLDLVKTKQKFTVIDNSSKKDVTTKTIQNSLKTLPLDLEALNNLIRG